MEEARTAQTAGEAPVPVIGERTVAANVDATGAAAFREIVHAHSRAHRRDLPWRRTRDPYCILVSELMLQQTQVPRVLLKYEEFLGRFPHIAALAAAPLSDVLAAWQGLGYNRRAVSLKRLAEIVVQRHGGSMPRAWTELRSLPGVGPSTAGAVAAFAYDEPHPFIETNIRAAYLHHFFADREGVSDSELLPLVEATLDRTDPREWYYALMDYGAWLKRTNPNPSRRSRHHTRQSAFAGSKRELRSQILRLILQRGTATADDLQAELTPTNARIPMTAVLEELTAEGFLKHDGGSYRIA